METGTSPRELFWVSGTGPREQSGPRIIVSLIGSFGKFHIGLLYYCLHVCVQSCYTDKSVLMGISDVGC